MQLRPLPQSRLPCLDLLRSALPTAVLSPPRTRWFYDPGRCGSRACRRAACAQSPAARAEVNRRSNLDSSLSIDPHYLRAPDERVLVDVLMPVDEKSWLRPLDVAIERLKPDVNLRIAFVDVPG